jgi:suppressor for copper-sensitivity B
MTLARFWFLAALSAGLAAWTGGDAHAATTNWVGDGHAAVRLIAAADSVSVATGSIDAGLEFRFAPGWHGYWRTPGDAGVAPSIDWSGSENIVRDEVSWPAPHRLVVEGLQNSVYDGHVVLPIKLALKQAGVPTRIRAAITYAACSDVCVPYQAELSLPLLPGSGAVSSEAALIGTARRAVPGTAAAAGIDVVRTGFAGTTSAPKLVVDLRSKGKPFAQPDLFVEGAGDGIPAAPNVELGNDGSTVRLTVALPAQLPSNRALRLTFADGDRSAEFPGPAGAAVVADPVRFSSALLAALLGGLILNLMPCVLPVLSIKLFAFTQNAGRGLREVRLGSAATAVGIVASFLLLASALVAFKWSGATLGWGIQFQQPWFLAGMAAVTVLFAASFLEWLPIGLPGSAMTALSGGSRGPIVEAFLTGMFATLLATPCSAPFVGTAVGFALAQGPLEIFSIFLCLGIGMALPFGMAALFPGSLAWLPRPGPWMLTLRRLLGALLLGTAVWLLFVLWSVAGARVAATTAFLLTCLLGYRAFASGRDPGDGSRWSGIVTAALAIAPLAAGLLLVTPFPKVTAGPEWQSFDPNAVPGLIAQGKTVLVDVTATWCLTCKVNELTVLGNAEVRSRLARPNIIRMRADWSRPDPSIASYLHGFARYGIPLDVVYGPQSPQGEALPEILTPGTLLQALNRVSGKSQDSTVGAPS